MRNKHGLIKTVPSSSSYSHSLDLDAFRRARFLTESQHAQYLPSARVRTVCYFLFGLQSRRIKMGEKKSGIFDMCFTAMDYGRMRMNVFLYVCVCGCL